MYSSQFPRDLFAQVERLQREMQQGFDTTVSPSIRGLARGYPALNVGSTATSVEVFAFVPGVDPAAIEVRLERGVLTIEGQRAPLAAVQDGKTTVHVNERFDGRFSRVISLPDDIDPAAVTATCRDGVLRISVPRRESAQPRRIPVQ